jgi:hypothetical protein
VPHPIPALTELGSRLSRLGWVSDLWVAGSLATGDHVPGVSDLDLVAVADGEVSVERHRVLAALHRDLDAGIAAGLDLGCAYVDQARLLDAEARHPTWTHGDLVQRTMSGVTRAELARHGYALLGRAPSDVLPPMSEDDVREATRAEVTGYWAWAARRPWLWLDPVVADLGLTSMARARHSLATGQLLTKTAAVEQTNAPVWLVDQLRDRRRGERVSSPRVRTAFIAWRDARRTVRLARSSATRRPAGR